MSHSLETIVAWAKRKWFVYPNSEIYGGLANMRDYGPYWSLLRKNIYDLWRKHFVQEREDMVWLDTTILAHPTTRQASGHLAGFSDALIDDKKTGQRFRADKIIEEYVEWLSTKMPELTIVVDCIHTTIKKLDNPTFGQNIVVENLEVNKELVDYLMTLPQRKVFVTNADSAIIKEVFKQYWDIEIFTLNNNPNKSDLEYYKQLSRYLQQSPLHCIYFDHNEKNIDSAKNAWYNQLLLHTNNRDTIQWIETKINAYSDIQKYVKERYGFDNLSPEARGNEGMHRFIVGEKLKNPTTGKDADWTEVRQFNLMLNTHLWPVADDANKVYMRPETCQSLFTDFRNVCDTTRMRIPFGLAQIGKAFRNEITPGQFMYRTREFEQMEIEYFVPADADNAMKVFEQRKSDSMYYWTNIIGISSKNLRFKDHDKLAHYAAAATDIEYRFPRWFGEVQWVHNRTDFDLHQHQEYSKQNMQYTDPKTGARYIPRCIEASTGLGRQVMVTMLEFYDEEIVKKENSDGSMSEDTRVVVRFPFAIAPVKYAILPLIEKDEAMMALGRQIYDDLKSKYKCEFDASGNIGKRYRRQDEIGTPYCICIDHQSTQDGTVTIRDRDTMEQTRVAWEDIKHTR